MISQTSIAPACLLALLALVIPLDCQQLWRKQDNFDDIVGRIDKVTTDNCAVLDRNHLFLPMSTVSHIPDIKHFGIDPIYQNRTNLLQIHNLALNRAFFYSYILQKAQDDAEPGFMYYMLAATADVSANPHVNSSAIYYSPNRAFTPSYNGFFNKTMPLFAPRAYRVDDYNDPYQLKGISTMNTIAVTDLGAIRPEMRDSNYTTDVYKINEWYSAWLPDLTKRHDSKPTYGVQISHANGTNETFVFHGPPGASDEPGPVKWQRPYFDCGRSNKWLVGASVPIADLFPRHTGWRHIELPIHVAVSVIEMDFHRLDINQCPASEGNGMDSNYFADTDKCKHDTTVCEPIHGYGFRRGGYQCHCRPGHRLPKHVRAPYLGELIERSSDFEYKQGFSCQKIDNLAVKTQNVQPLSPRERRIIISRIETATGISNDSQSSRLDINQVAEEVRKPSTNRDECQIKQNVDPSKLKMPGNIAHGKELQFENQARAALRLSHFISSFLQVVDAKEVFAEFRVPDKPLTRDQVIGETVSTLIGDRQIVGLGVWFDRNQFPDKTKPNSYFAPYAYRLERNARNFFVIDMAARSPNQDDHYTQNESFQKLKTRWMTGTENLDMFTVKANIRFNSSGLNLIKYDRYPIQYKVAQLEHGYWSEPFLDCHLHNQWLISYASPFFGPDKLKLRVEFKGVVIVNLKLSELDVNQCDADYHVSNAFKGTHKCDRKSTRCFPVSGRKFESGGYRCECKQGYEYPFNQPTTYIDGQMMEAEYMNVVQGNPSRFDSLACRLIQY
jgi:hypothetical protein